MNLLSKSLLSLGKFSAIISFNKLSASYSSNSNNLQTGPFTGIPQNMEASKILSHSFSFFSSDAMISMDLSLSSHVLFSVWSSLMLELLLIIVFFSSKFLVCVLHVFSFSSLNFSFCCYIVFLIFLYSLSVFSCISEHLFNKYFELFVGQSLHLLLFGTSY